MRGVLIAAALIALLFVVGWLSFRYDGRQASLNFNAEAAREDTRALVEKGEVAVERATERGRELIDDSARDAERSP